MSSYKNVLGENLVSHQGEVSIDKLYESRYVALYFGASWCPNTSRFTDELIKFYNYVNEDLKQFEVILVTNDDDKHVCDNFYATMPWLTLPFDPKYNQELFVHYDVVEVPC